jgi:putative DNA primase/helicase
MAVNLLDFANTDLGNGERFAACHAGNLLHVHGRGWHVWAGTHWQPDESGAAIEGAKTVTRRLARDAAEAANAAGRTPVNPTTGRPMGMLTPAEQAEKWAIASQSARHLYAMAELAASEPGMAATGLQLDTDPYLLNATDGTIDLRTGKTGKHDPRHRITRVCPASLRAAGPSQRWYQFLDEILPDPRLQAYVQRAIGCSLVGKQRDHVIFIAYGGGGNGKGTLFRAVRAAVGPYYGALPAEAVIETSNQQHPTLYADLFGKRIVVTAELPRGKKIDEGRLNSISGGDAIKARYIGQDFFEFEPSHTPWLATNDKPRITSTDNGIWRRLRLIPFLQTIPAERRDPTLDDQLAACRNAILAWCVEGAVAYLSDGLGTCDAVTDATDNYRSEEDLFGAALDDLTTDKRFDGTPIAYADERGHITKTALRSLLAAWYADAGYQYAPNDRQIKQEMDRRGIVEKKIQTESSNARAWACLRQRDNLPAEWLPKQAARSWHDRD